MVQVDDSIIHAIYGCATGEARWEDALRPIMGLMGASCCGVVRHSIAPVGAEVLVSIDVDPQTQSAYVSEYVRKNPVMNCLSAMPLGFVTCGSGAVDEKFYLESSFYNDWQRPAGYSDNLGIALARRAGEFVLLSMPRDFETGPYTPEDLARVKPYVRHLVRAFNIWLRISVAETQAGWVNEMLDQVGKGLIILGEDRVILYANKSGERMLDAHDGLARVSFKLVAHRSDIQAGLDAALAPFEAGLAEDTREYGFAVTRADRPPLFVRVQPPLGLRPGQRSFGLPKAVAFLHIVDPEENERPNLELYGSAHGLTAGELRFLEALVTAESVKEAARMIAISEATARTHMSRICAKTGARNFAGLIAQVHRSVAVP